MEKMKIGVLGTANIAFRRFLPALMQCESFAYSGIASRTLTRTIPFLEQFGAKSFANYEELLDCVDIDAVYIPLPPALHYEWAKKALEQGKHVFLEKPSTTSFAETKMLVALAEEKNLALHENYMFVYHKQFSYIKDLIQSGQFGLLRQLDLTFSFPRRNKEDFRYNKELGGGALLDCGGYTVKGALELLGDTVTVISSVLCYENEIDLYGSVTLKDEQGIIAHLGFGMDNSYRCDININAQWGNIYADRIFTAPKDYKSRIITNISNNREEHLLDEDDQFLHSIEHFYQCIKDRDIRRQTSHSILKQSRVISEIIEMEGKTV